MISNIQAPGEDHHLTYSLHGKDYLDTRGKSCPIPLFMANTRLKHMSRGEILEIISDCASLLPDLQSAFTRRCTILESIKVNDIYTITLRKT